MYRLKTCCTSTSHGCQHLYCIWSCDRCQHLYCICTHDGDIYIYTVSVPVMGVNIYTVSLPVIGVNICTVSVPVIDLNNWTVSVLYMWWISTTGLSVPVTGMSTFVLHLYQWRGCQHLSCICACYGRPHLYCICTCYGDVNICAAGCCRGTVHEFPSRISSDIGNCICTCDGCQHLYCICTCDLYQYLYLWTVLYVSVPVIDVSIRERKIAEKHLASTGSGWNE
jgi:hypothetical protein